LAVAAEQAPVQASAQLKVGNNNKVEEQLQVVVAMAETTPPVVSRAQQVVQQAHK
jgi:hypothetical protein